MVCTEESHKAGVSFVHARSERPSKEKREYVLDFGLRENFMAKRIKPGDVIEIPTSRGLAYAQYALKKEQWGALIRILAGFFEERPTDLCVVSEAIEFDLIERTFEIPAFIELNRKLRSVVCRRCWCAICEIEVNDGASRKGFGVETSIYTHARPRDIERQVHGSKDKNMTRPDAASIISDLTSGKVDKQIPALEQAVDLINQVIKVAVETLEVGPERFLKHLQ